MKINISAIFLSKTFNHDIYEMTLNAINTLKRSEVNNIFNIDCIVIESEKDTNFYYPNYIKVITPDEPFNFHRFLNIGIQSSKSDWYLLCNNDIEFDIKWLTEIFSIANKYKNIDSFSPMCPLSKKQNALKKSTNKKYVIGFEPASYISGWCILLKDSAYNEISHLDERFDFYFADDDYGLTLRQHNLKHALVFSSLVTHLEHKKVSDQVGVTNEIKFDKTKIPSYLYWERFKWVWRNQKMFDGYLFFYKKWGDWRVLKLKKIIHNIFIYVGINGIGKILFTSFVE